MRGTTRVMRPSSVSMSTVPPDPAATARSTASAAATDTIAVMICPPSKASSMRIESSGRAHHLGQDAVDGVGMDECDLEPEKPMTRSLVDQLDSVGRKVSESAATSSTTYATWCIPGPRFAMNFPTGVSSPVGASSSTRSGPTRTDGGVDALVGRARHGARASHRGRRRTSRERDRGLRRRRRRDGCRALSWGRCYCAVPGRPRFEHVVENAVGDHLRRRLGRFRGRESR